MGFILFIIIGFVFILLIKGAFWTVSQPIELFLDAQKEELKKFANEGGNLLISKINKFEYYIDLLPYIRNIPPKILEFDKDNLKFSFKRNKRITETNYHTSAKINGIINGITINENFEYYISINHKFECHSDISSKKIKLRDRFGIILLQNIISEVINEFENEIKKFLSLEEINIIPHQFCVYDYLQYSKNRKIFKIENYDDKNFTILSDKKLAKFYFANETCDQFMPKFNFLDEFIILSCNYKNNPVVFKISFKEWGIARKNKIITYQKI